MEDQLHIVKQGRFELSIKDFLDAALKANRGARELIARTDDLSFYIANLDALPPGIVLWDEERKRYALTDGWHRLQAAIRLGRKTFVVVEATDSADSQLKYDEHERLCASLWGLPRSLFACAPLGSQRVQ